MFLSRVFSNVRAKVMTALVGLTMLLGVGAALSNVTSLNNHEVVETNAMTSCYFSGKGAGTSSSDVSWDWTDRSMTKLTSTLYWINLYCWDYVEFSFKPDNSWVNQTSDRHYGSGVTAINTSGNNYVVRLTAGSYDIYFAYSSGSFQELYIQAHDAGTKTVKFYKEGGSWTPTNIHYYVRGTDHIGTTWPGDALSTNYEGTTGLFYKSGIKNCFNGYNLTSNSGSNQSVDVIGSTSGDELYFFNGSKDGSNYKVFSKSQSKSAGYYLFGDASFSGSSGAAWNIIGAKAPTSTDTDGNHAAWSSVTFAVSDNFKIGYYEDNGTITFQNQGWGESKAETHGWFTWADNKDAHNIICNQAGTYKVYLNGSYYTLINIDVTVACYQVWAGNTVKTRDITGNSDISLSTSISGAAEHPFPAKAGFRITGYYSDSGCTVTVDIANFFPTANLSLYATYEPTMTVIPNNKVRVWVTYYDSRNSQGTYFDSDSAKIKLWTHKNQENADAGENIYDAGTTYNNNADSRRYDYFDINLSDFSSGWYLTVQRFNSAGTQYWNSTENSNTYKCKLSASNASKVFSIKCTSDLWWIDTEEIASPDTELAVLALCGLHTCSSSSFNGYGAFANYNSTFVKNGSSWKINDSYYDELVNYYVNDFASMDTSYSGSASTVTNAYSKYVGLSNMNSTNGRSVLGARAISGNGEASPLTLTLWIVLGCGLAGLAAIGTAYFVSKKKKRPLA